jgi:hypothetical protein
VGCLSPCVCVSSSFLLTKSVKSRMEEYFALQRELSNSRARIQGVQAGYKYRYPMTIPGTGTYLLRTGSLVSRGGGVASSSRTGTVYETTRRAGTQAAFSTRVSGTFIFLDRVRLLKTLLRTVLQAEIDYLVQTYIRESMLHADFRVVRKMLVV